MNDKPLSTVVTAILAQVLVAVTPTKGEAFHLMWSEEATIADIHAAFRSKELTCRQLVQHYIDRIEAYDKKGPELNAIIMINPSVLASIRSSPLYERLGRERLLFNARAVIRKFTEGYSGAA